MLPLLSLQALSMETMLFRTGLIGPHAYTAPGQEKPEPSGTWAGGTKEQAKARVAPCKTCQRELVRDARASTHHEGVYEYRLYLYMYNLKGPQDLRMI